LVALGLVLFLGLQLLLADAFYLFYRPFWLDELYTYTLVTDPDVGHSLEALAGGVETHPPTLYFLLRAYTFVAGTSETAFRSLAFLAMLLTLAGVYLTLRHTYALLPTLTAVLVLWCHPLVVQHAFEARFYGVWMAVVVWFAYFLARAGTLTPSVGQAFQPDVGANEVRLESLTYEVGTPRRNNLWLAVCAVLLCTIHYFGVITLGLIVAGELLARRQAGARRWPGMVAVLAGPVALAACVPLLLSQKGALTVTTWADPATPASAVEFLTRLFLLPPFFYPILVIVGWSLLAGLAARRHRPSDLVRFPARHAGLTSLALLPLVLILFSFLVQPVLVSRYALPAVAGLAPIVAAFAARLGWAGNLGFCVLLAAISTLGLHTEVQEQRRREAHTQELVQAIRTTPTSVPVLFEVAHQLYVICHYEPELAARCYFLDFEEGQLKSVSRFRVFNRDLARRYASFYGQPRLLPWETARTMPGCYLVPDLEEGQKLSPEARHRYPGFVLRQVENGLYKLGSP
jgi:hypothetical protein